MVELNTQPVSASPTTNGLPGTLTLLGAALKNLLPKVLTLLVISIVPIGIIALLAVFAPLILMLLVSALAGIWLPVPIIILGIAAPIIAISFIMAWAQLAIIYAIRGFQLGAALNASTKDLFSYFKIILIGEFIALGATFLFVLPGIAVSVWFAFAAFIFADQKKRGLAVLSQSRALVQGRWWSIFGRFFVAGIILLGPMYIITLLNESFVPQNYQSIIQIVLMVAQFLIGLLAIAFTNELYNNIKNQPTEPIKSNKPLVAMALAGYVLLFAGGAYLISVVSNFIPQMIGPPYYPDAPSNSSIPNDTESRDARDAKRLQDISQMQLALALYKNDQGTYPSTLDALVDTGFIGTLPNDPDMILPSFSNTSTASPLEPPKSFPYFLYAVSPTKDKYHLGIALENPENKALCTDADFDTKSNPNGGFEGFGDNPTRFCDGERGNDNLKYPMYDVAG